MSLPRAELCTSSGAPIGFVRSFNVPGPANVPNAALHAAAARAVEQVRAAGARHLRTEVDLDAGAGPESRHPYSQLFDTLASCLDILPSLSSTAAPARIEAFLAGCGARVRWVELRCLDAADTVGLLSRLCQVRAHGKRVVVAAPAGLWPALLGTAPELARADAFGLLDVAAGEAAAAVDVLRTQLPRSMPVWICEMAPAGEPLTAFVAAARPADTHAAGAAVERLYWRQPGGEAGWLAPDRGLSLLPRLLAQDGLAAVADLARLAAQQPAPPYVLITGGAGFIGCNLAARLLAAGERVLIYDTLVRPGTEQNLRWLMARHPGQVGFVLADVRDRDALAAAVAGADSVYHFAAQVAVTTSLEVPVFDLDVNAGGTLCLLEAVRASGRALPVVFTSTNKVYGGLHGAALEAAGTRYQPVDPRLRAEGIDETQALEFRSPYGCSKGAADQYVLDYAHTFGLATTVLRMSCIYGPHQFGTEDQGWVAHFLRQALAGAPITVYGDGLQVRDVLYVDDLVEALLLARDHLPRIAGQAFNIGGGPQNVLSLSELLSLIERLQGHPPTVRRCDWRPGDQRYYVSNVRRFARATGWTARTDVSTGVARLYDWLGAHRPPVAAPRSERELAL